MSRFFLVLCVVSSFALTPTLASYSAPACRFPSVRIMDGAYSENNAVAANIGHLQQKHPGERLRILALNSNMCDFSDADDCLKSVNQSASRNLFADSPYAGEAVWSPTYVVPCPDHQIFSESVTTAQVYGIAVGSSNETFMTGTFTTVFNKNYGITAGTTVDLVILHTNTMAGAMPSPGAYELDKDLATDTQTAAAQILSDLSTVGYVSSTGAPTTDASTGTGVGPVTNTSTTVPWALALSGGGFRAMGAGAGAVKALHEAGMLQGLSTVSSVSGGSWFSTQFFFSAANSNGLLNASSAGAWYESYLTSAIPDFYVQWQLCGNCWQNMIYATYGLAVASQSATPGNRVGITDADLLVCMTMATQGLMSDGSNTTLYHSASPGSALAELELPTYYHIPASASASPSWQIPLYDISALQVGTSASTTKVPLSLPTPSVGSVGAMSSADYGASGVPRARAEFPPVFCDHLPCSGDNLGDNAVCSNSALPSGKNQMSAGGIAALVFGSLACIAIATGLIMWAEKPRKAAKASGEDRAAPAVLVNTITVRV